MTLSAPGLSAPHGISGRTRVYGLIGHPVRHSLSPTMHSHLFGSIGLDAVYLGFDVHPSAADRLADAIRTLNLAGVNLTVPFKERVLPHLDRVTRAAQEAGACNLVTNVDGFLTGYNTDGEGLVRSLAAEHGLTPRGLRCVVLGAGGAGRAVAASLGAAGALAVTFLNRTPSRARDAVDHLRAWLPGVRFDWLPLDGDAMVRAAIGCGLVVNCLGAGGEDPVRGFPVHALPPDAVWVDTNYWMADPPALDACARRGLRTSTGIGMLIHQGALSFELFTGYPVDAEALRPALERSS